MFLDELALRYGTKLRDAKWRLYCDAFPPHRGERVLDVGVSNLDDLPNENYFLGRYPYATQVTAVGISDLAPLEARYPDVTFVQADGRDLPFADSSFDVVHSNAVVEHVGAAREQARFVSELVRVAPRGMITTPNRLFPFESHTRLPLVHWLPRPLMLRAFDMLSRPERGIWLLTPRRFRQLFPRDVALRTHVQRIAGLPATVAILYSR
jgi:hypothetical protein